MMFLFSVWLALAMAKPTIWDQLLKERFAVYDVKLSIYKDNMSRLNKPRAFAKAICDTLCPTEVPFTLRRLYHEAVYGSDAKVRLRILNRMNTIARSVR